MLRLFSEQEANERAFTALTRFLDALDDAPARRDRPALDPLGLSFQLKLLWVSGYLPHLTSCAECGARTAARRLLAARRRRRVRRCRGAEAIGLSPEGIRGIEGLLASPLADAHDPGRRARRARRAARHHRDVRVPRRLPPAYARA